MVVDNIRDSIKGVVEYLRQNPEKGRSTDSPATAYYEGGLTFRVEGAIHPVFTDMVPALGGSGNAPSPGWMLRAALASCDGTLIAMRAAQEGVRLTHLQVTVDSESDDSGMMGVDDSVPAGPLSVRTRVQLSAENATPEDLRALVRWAEAHSPVPDALRRAVPSTIEVEVL